MPRHVQKASRKVDFPIYRSGSGPGWTKDPGSLAQKKG